MGNHLFDPTGELGVFSAPLLRAGLRSTAFLHLDNAHLCQPTVFSHRFSYRMTFSAKRSSTSLRRTHSTRQVHWSGISAASHSPGFGSRWLARLCVFGSNSPLREERSALLTACTCRLIRPGLSLPARQTPSPCRLGPVSNRFLFEARPAGGIAGCRYSGIRRSGWRFRFGDRTTNQPMQYP
jgi:hypothetical protein